MASPASRQDYAEIPRRKGNEGLRIAKEVVVLNGPPLGLYQTNKAPEECLYVESRRQNPA